MTSTWQERAVLEMNELADRIGKLCSFLLTFDGPEIDDQVRALMQAQYKAMVAYYDALSARLRMTGVVDVETPPVVRGELGTPAAVEVTVTAPAGKRAMVSVIRGDKSRQGWTVTEGKTQTWACIGQEMISVSEEPTRTVAHKRDNG